MTKATPATTSPSQVVTAESQQKMDRLLEMIVAGDSANNAIKATFGDRRTFCRIISQDPSLNVQYLNALGIRADILADECIEIADKELDPNRAKVRVTARQWLAAKYKPKTYSERLEMALEPSISILGVLGEAQGRVVRDWRKSQEEVTDAEIVSPSDLPAIGESKPRHDHPMFS